MKEKFESKIRTTMQMNLRNQPPLLLLWLPKETELCSNTHIRADKIEKDRIIWLVSEIIPSINQGKAVLLVQIVCIS